MSKTAKEIVKSFYQENLLRDPKIIQKYFHPEMVLIWNSADGLSIMHFAELAEFFAEIGRTYDDIRVEISHLLEDGNHITIRYKYYVRTIENPDEELGIAHFIAIWEVKDDMLYRGYQISQPVTDNDDTQESYHKVKV
jgi:predicted SnoaL-like aldol condensation-catalyzing enzyme